MRKILTGLILGSLLTWGSLWMLGYRSSKADPASSESSDALIHSFPNKKLTYWTEVGCYEFHLYGEMAFIRRRDLKIPKEEIEPEEFKAIWNQLEKLPDLKKFQNSEASTVGERSTHRVVFVNDAAGLYLNDRFSYSIPKVEASAAYREWFDQIETTIRKYKSEQATSSDGNEPSN